jgi:3,4-dihydroxy 2-butanone 4-phosphate synthase / GTP cyclohydrolase II
MDVDACGTLWAMRASNPFSNVEEALSEIAAGRMIVVVDDEDRENEGDLVMAAQHVTPEAINFMTRQAGGWICLSLTAERCDELGLPLMSLKNESPHETPFTVTIEAREGVTTGVSTADQARTMVTAVDPAKGPGDIVVPGHVRPLRARDGGVLERTGHTEAAVDLARLAGCLPAGVICEVQNANGTMARVPDLELYCFRHGLKMITIADLISYRLRNEKLISREAETSLPTAFGDFTAVGYLSLLDARQHVALVKGKVDGEEDVLVRMHSECLTGDALRSLECDCREQLERSMAMIDSEGRGVVVYLAQEARGIGVLNRLHAPASDDGPLADGDAVPAPGQSDLRDFGIGAQILVDLGLTSIRILTNNPKRIHGLGGYGLSVTDQVPVTGVPDVENVAYLRGRSIDPEGTPTRTAQSR